MTHAVRFDFQIAKASPTGRFVTGWFSVVEKDGKPVEDTQGDIISIEEGRKAFQKFMRGERIIKARHKGEKVGEVVEMLFIDDDVAKALGMSDTKRGAFGTAEITDPQSQKEVREGILKSFSIGGRGKRTAIQKNGIAKSRGDGRFRLASLNI